MKISKEMIQEAYLYSKKVYNKEMDKTTATNKLYDSVGFHQGSASDYIGAFSAMMEGKKYTRTINTEATQYYLENIKNDYGLHQLELSLNAVTEHTKYYGNLGRGNLRSIEKVVSEFKSQYFVSNK